MKNFSRTARSIMLYAIYLGISGVGLSVIPNEFLSLFGITFEEETFVRLSGLLAFALAFKGFLAGRREDRDSVQVDVYTRVIFATGVVVLVVTKIADPLFLVIAAVDYLASLWSQWAINKDKKEDAA